MTTLEEARERLQALVDQRLEAAKKDAKRNRGEPYGAALADEMEFAGIGGVSLKDLLAILDALKASEERVKALEESSAHVDLSNGALMETRRVAKEVMGWNTCFVDDDVKILGRLALNAIDAGLFDGLSDPIADECRKAAAARKLVGETGGGE